MASTEEELKRLIEEFKRSHGDVTRRQPAHRAPMNEHRDMRAEDIARGDTELVKTGKQRIAISEKLQKLAEEEAETQRDMIKRATEQQKQLRESAKLREEIVRLEQQEADLQDSMRAARKEDKRIFGQQIKQTAQGLKQKRMELQTTMKNHQKELEGIRKKAGALKSVRSTIRGATEDLEKMRAAEAKLSSIKYPKTSPLSNIIAGQRGSGLLGAARAYKIAQAANAERTALGIGGHVSPLREAAGAFGDASRGSHLGDLALAGARGGVMGVAAEGGKKLVGAVAGAALDQGDKLLRLAAIHKKVTNSIETGSREAVHDMSGLMKEFASAYSSSVGALMRYGVGKDEAYALVERFTRSIRPTKDMSKQLTQLTIDTQRFAIGFNMSAEEVAADSEAMFAQFGMQQPKITKAYESMYSVFNDANKKTIKGFDEIIVRMDDWTRIVHDSARRAGLWTFSYGAMADMMARIATETAKGNMALAQRKQIGAAVAGALTGQGPDWVEYKVSERFMQDVINVGGKAKTPEELKELLGNRYGDLKDHQIENMFAEMQSAQANPQLMALAGKHAMAGIDSARIEGFRGDVYTETIATGRNRTEKTELLKSMLSKYGLDESSIGFLVSQIDKGGFAQGLRDEIKKSKLGQEKSGFGGQPDTGAGAIGAAERGLAGMRDILISSNAELTAISTTADRIADILEWFTKPDDPTRGPRHVAAVSKALGDLSQAEKEAILKTRRNPIQDELLSPGGMLGTMQSEKFLAMSEKDRIHTLRLQHRLSKDKATTLYKAFIGRASATTANQIAADQSLSVDERHEKLRALFGYSEEQATKLIADQSGLNTSDVRRTTTEEANRRASESAGDIGTAVGQMLSGANGTLDVKNQTLTVTMPVKVENMSEAVANGVGEANASMSQTPP